MTKLKINDFSRDQRVELSPETDRWFRGDRYGTVWVVGSRYVHVKMDRSGIIYFAEPSNIARILTDAPKESDHVS